jgi:hypothetical protein
MDERCERQPGETIDFRAGGRLTIVALWWCPGGSELRVVRWHLRGHERALYNWARGRDVATPTADEAAGSEEEWTAGVALERREGPTGRWSTVQRQELTGADPARFAARLNGWEAGLIDRAEKLARKTERL